MQYNTTVTQHHMTIVVVLFVLGCSGSGGAGATPAGASPSACATWPPAGIWGWRRKADSTWWSAAEPTLAPPLFASNPRRSESRWAILFCLFVCLFFLFIVWHSIIWWVVFTSYPPPLACLILTYVHFCCWQTIYLHLGKGSPMLQKGRWGHGHGRDQVRRLQLLHPACGLRPVADLPGGGREVCPHGVRAAQGRLLLFLQIVFFFW